MTALQELDDVLLTIAGDSPVESRVNPLLATDVYKIGHCLQYAPGVNKVYSYLCARTDRTYDHCVFFGLQYYLKKYLCQPITKAHADEFVEVATQIIGPLHPELKSKIYSLADLGYWPLEIKALSEGTVAPVKNAVLTIESTHPDFYWAVGFVESLLLKVWYPMTVATNVYQYRKHVDYTCDRTDGDNHAFRDFMVHDFGYRSDTSEESAAISGAAHLIMFRGSDTIPALPFIRDYYGADITSGSMLSVPATEHSVMCSYGVEGELDAYERLLDLYPSGIVSIVSDTYDIYRVCTEYLEILKPRILARDGKVVVRPDSGDPPNVICGDPNATEGSPARKGVLRLLAEKFGTTRNEKGLLVLNPKIGLIYGDGMYLERYKGTLTRIEAMGFAASNLVVGIGGILRQGTRDTLGMALKATYVEIDGEPRNIKKCPITDTGKKSHTGRFQVYRDEHGTIRTRDEATPEQERDSILQTVFLNGNLVNEITFPQVKANFNETRER